MAGGYNTERWSAQQRWRAARDPHAPPDLLEELARLFPETRPIIIRNPNVPAELLKRLVQTPVPNRESAGIGQMPRRVPPMPLTASVRKASHIESQRVRIKGLTVVAPIVGIALLIGLVAYWLEQPTEIEKAVAACEARSALVSSDGRTVKMFEQTMLLPNGVPIDRMDCVLNYLGIPPDVKMRMNDSTWFREETVKSGRHWVQWENRGYFGWRVYVSTRPIESTSGSDESEPANRTNLPQGETEATSAVPEPTLRYSKRARDSTDATTSLRDKRPWQLRATLEVGEIDSTPVVTPDGTAYVLAGTNMVVAIKNDEVAHRIAVERTPTDIAVAPDGTVYVANSMSNSVSVILGSEVATTVWVGPVPQRLAVGEDGTAYVSSTTKGTVEVLRDGKVAGTFQIGGYPEVPAIAPDGSVYVTAIFDSLVTRIRTDGSIQSIPVGSAPYGVAVAPDGLVYVTNHSDNSVSVIREAEVIGTIPVGSDAQRPVVAADGTVYVSNRSQDSVSIIKAGQLVGSVDVGSYPQAPAIGPDGTAYVSNKDDGTLSIIKDGAVVATVPVGDSPGTPGVASDGTIYVPNVDQGTITIVR